MSSGLEHFGWEIVVIFRLVSLYVNVSFSRDVSIFSLAVVFSNFLWRALVWFSSFLPFLRFVELLEFVVYCFHKIYQNFSHYVFQYFFLPVVPPGIINVLVSVVLKLSLSHWGSANIKKVLSRYNSYTIQFTHLKYRMQRFLVISRYV